MFGKRAPIRQRPNRQNRRGIATVECALCLPLLLAITMASIDICSAIFLKESLTLAAYEGARVGVSQGGTNSSVVAKVEEFLTQRGVVYDANAVTISTPSFEDAGTLEHVTITVTVPCAGNMPLTGGLFIGRTIDASVTMRKEFANL